MDLPVHVEMMFESDILVRTDIRTRWRTFQAAWPTGTDWTKEAVMDEMDEFLESIMPDGWEVQDDVTLICPCGDPVEYDGQCSEGHVSPLRTMGMI